MTTTTDTPQPAVLPASRAAAPLPRSGDRITGLAAPLFVFWSVFAWIFYLSASVSPAYFGIGVDNFWFDADVPRYVCQSVDALANDHWRNKVHPLFSLLVWPLPNALHALGLDLILALRLQIALVAATGMVFLHLTARALGLHSVVSLLLVAVVATSASVMAWFSVTESYPYTFAALMLALYMLVRSATHPSSTFGWAGAIALSFAITISNIALAALVAFQALKFKRVVWALMLAVAAVGILAVAQRLLFPASGVFFLPSALQGESEFMRELTADRLRDVLTVVFAGSFLFPQVQKVLVNGEQVLTVQHAGLPLDAVPMIGLVLLVVLYGLGLYLLARRLGGALRSAFAAHGALPREPAALLAVPVLGGLVFLLALHAVYGKETFLYTGSFLPLLAMVLCVALGSAPMLKYRLAIPILVGLLAVNVTHNLPVLHQAGVQLQQDAALPLEPKALKRNTCSFVKRNLLSQASGQQMGQQ